MTILDETDLGFNLNSPQIECWSSGKIPNHHHHQQETTDWLLAECRARWEAMFLIIKVEMGPMGHSCDSITWPWLPAKKLIYLSLPVSSKAGSCFLHCFIQKYSTGLDSQVGHSVHICWFDKFVLFNKLLQLEITQFWTLVWWWCMWHWSCVGFFFFFWGVTEHDIKGSRNRGV